MQVGRGAAGPGAREWRGRGTRRGGAPPEGHRGPCSRVGLVRQDREQEPALEREEGVPRRRSGVPALFSAAPRPPLVEGWRGVGTGRGPWAKLG